jgi:hypothetical protein
MTSHVKVKLVYCVWKTVKHWIPIVKPTICTSFTNLIILNTTLRVSDYFSVHHQEFKTVRTATGLRQIDTATCLLARMRWKYQYRNIKGKLFRTNAAIWYNKICREKQLAPHFPTPSHSRYQAGSSICLTYACCYIYSLELLMMDRKTVPKTCRVVFKTNKFVKQVHPAGFTIGIYYDARTHERQIGYWINFHKADDQRDFSEHWMVANSEFFTVQVCTTCYKSLVKLLLAQLTK